MVETDTHAGDNALAANAAMAVLCARGLIARDAGPSLLSDPERLSGASATLDLMTPALKAAGLTKAEALDGIDGGWFWLSGLGRAGVLTEFAFSPRQQALTIVAAGGDREELRELAPALEEFARLTGCNAVLAPAKCGLARDLRARGYARSGPGFSQQITSKSHSIKGAQRV